MRTTLTRQFLVPRLFERIDGRPRRLSVGDVGRVGGTLTRESRP